nr:MAG TPA: hypothetical protein [Caudoviricetes sp.]
MAFIFLIHIALFYKLYMIIEPRNILKMGYKQYFRY